MTTARQKCYISPVAAAESREGCWGLMMQCGGRRRLTVISAYASEKRVSVTINCTAAGIRTTEPYPVAVASAGYSLHTWLQRPPLGEGGATEISRTLATIRTKPSAVRVVFVGCPGQWSGQWNDDAMCLDDLETRMSRRGVDESVYICLSINSPVAAALSGMASGGDLGNSTASVLDGAASQVGMLLMVVVDEADRSNKTKLNVPASMIDSWSPTSCLLPILYLLRRNGPLTSPTCR